MQLFPNLLVVAAVDGGGHTIVAGNGLSGTGGGGGGANAPGPAVGVAGGGGSGIVVVRYQIAEITATAKATGGAISFYGGKTIHAFTNSGSFENTSGSSLLMRCKYCSWWWWRWICKTKLA